jgi:hypothetical protein
MSRRADIVGPRTLALEQEKETSRQDYYAQLFTAACGEFKGSADIAPTHLKKRPERILCDYVSETRLFDPDAKGRSENAFLEDELVQRSKKSWRRRERQRRRMAEFILAKRKKDETLLQKEQDPRLPRCKHGMLIKTCSLCPKPAQAVAGDQNVPLKPN